MAKTLNPLIFKTLAVIAFLFLAGTYVVLVRGDFSTFHLEDLIVSLVVTFISFIWVIPTIRRAWAAR